MGAEWEPRLPFDPEEIGGLEESKRKKTKEQRGEGPGEAGEQAGRRSERIRKQVRAIAEQARARLEQSERRQKQPDWQKDRFRKTTPSQARLKSYKEHIRESPGSPALEKVRKILVNLAEKEERDLWGEDLLRSKDQSLPDNFFPKQIDKKF